MLSCPTGVQSSATNGPETCTPTKPDPSGVYARSKAMDTAFPDACVPDDRVQACLLAAQAIAAETGKPHAGDVHVLAAAMAVEADFIVTTNTDHFPDRVTWNRVSILRTTPDDFLTRLLLDCSDVVIAGYQRQILSTKTKPRTLTDMVRRLADPQMTPVAAQMLARKLANPDEDIDLG